MVKINPELIKGNWREGYCLDKHSVSSTPVGIDELGHTKFDTTRTDLGELLYRYKYKSDKTGFNALIEIISNFLSERWNPSFDVIVPVPPTKTRAVQPVLELCSGIAKKINKPCEPGCIIKIKETAQAKDIDSREEKKQLIQQAIKIDEGKVAGKKILVFDDLYGTGATLEAVTDALIKAGAKEVFALAITRKRGGE